VEGELFSYKKIRKMNQEGLENPEKFWRDRMNLMTWFKEPVKILEGTPPFEKWFVGGISNLAYNAVDRHLPNEANKVIFYWMDEKGNTKSITYQDLYYEVNRAAYVLKEMGVKHGDTVSMLMASSPEAVIFGLAVHRLGAIAVIHYVGLTDEIIATRFVDTGSKYAVVFGNTINAGSEINIKNYFDNVANKFNLPIEKVLVVSRGFTNFSLKQNRDIVYEDIAPKGKVYVPPEPVEANEVGTIYYTSGTTGKPKGITQTQIGYPLSLNWTFRGLYDLRPNDVWWTVSALGWPVWPMANLYTAPVSGITSVLFEGYIGAKPDLWSRIVERFNVSLVWQSTTSLYALKSLGEESVKAGDTSSLRIVLNTGETLNVGFFNWFREQLPDVYIGDAYWFTEHLSPAAATPYGIGEIPFKPGSAGIEFPLSKVVIVDDDGTPLPPGKKGYIVLKPYSPALGKMWNDPNLERYSKVYTSRFPGYVFFGDYGYMDSDGYLFVLGRADDVLKPGGERVGTMEVESLIGNHQAVAEVAATSMPSFEGKGEKLLLFVVPRKDYTPDEKLSNQLKEYAKNSGFIIDYIVFVNKLPKTKSGKIMRRLLRATVRNEPLGDLSTLDDPVAFEDLRKRYEEFKKAMSGS
jgi:acetyl-CoA synthetase